MDPEFNQTFPVIAFTCDDRNVIKTRILLQLSILRFMCNDVVGSKLKLVPGEIHFIDIQTGKVNAEPLIIADIKESETFEIKLEELPLGSESYVEFIKSTPITVTISHNRQFANIFEPQSFEELQKLLNLRKDSISTVFSFNEALDIMIKNQDPFPCILDPLAKLNDLEDPKPKRQEAAYVFQRDLRYPINRYASIEKIVIKKKLQPFIKKYLEWEKLNILRSYLPLSDYVLQAPD